MGGWKDHGIKINLDSINWYLEKQSFETIREAHEWVYSGAYNEIGSLYNGYKCEDPKLVYALLFEIVRANTLLGHRFDVHCDYDVLENSLVYKLWVTQPQLEPNK